MSELKYPSEQIALDYINSQMVKNKVLLIYGINAKDYIKLITNPTKCKRWGNLFYYEVALKLEILIEKLNNKLGITK